jgi:hypothetical protein
MIKKILSLFPCLLLAFSATAISAPSSLRPKASIQSSPIIPTYLNVGLLKCNVIEQFEEFSGNGGTPLPGAPAVGWPTPMADKSYCGVDCVSPPQDSSSYATMIRKRCKVTLLYIDVCGITASNACRDNLGIDNLCPAPSYSNPPSPCPLDPNAEN